MAGNRLKILFTAYNYKKNPASYVSVPECNLGCLVGSKFTPPTPKTNKQIYIGGVN